MSKMPVICTRWNVNNYSKYHVVRSAPLRNETIKLQNVKKQKHGGLGAATAAYRGERGVKGSV